MRGIRVLAAVVASVVTGALMVATGSGTASATPPTNWRVNTIVNGVAWNDTAGNYITAHLGSSFKVGSTYYWCGDNWPHVPNPPYYDYGHEFAGVECYTSTNLTTWAHSGTALAVDSSGSDGMLTSSRLVERPKVVYNATTHKYVMWFHDDSLAYTDFKIGVATADNPAGPYTWVHDSDSSGFRGCGTGTGDMTLYQEGNDVYFVHTTTHNADIVIQKLNGADYLTCSTTTMTNLGGNREAPQLIKVNGTYFLFTSATNWWAPSQGKYRTATSLSGPWSAWANFGSSITAASQGADIIPVTGSLGTTFVMMGDRLQGGGSGDYRWNVNQSQYVWLPLTISGTTARLDYVQSWAIDTTTGLWSTSDAQPCDLSWFTDFESPTGKPLTPQSGTWHQTEGNPAPTGNATNTIYQHLGTTGDAAYLYNSASYADYYVQAFAQRVTASTEVTIEGRVQPDFNHFYTLTLNDTGWKIYVANGAYGVVASGTTYPNMSVVGQWYLMRLVMQGSTLTGMLSIDNGVTWTVLGGGTDTTFASGTAGVAASNAANFDSVAACSLSTAGQSPARPLVSGFGINASLAIQSVPGQCATAAGINGTQVFDAACTTADTWSWEQFPENTNGSGRVVNWDGRCLDAAYANAVAGNAVVKGDCYNAPASATQRWIVVPRAGGWFALQNAASPVGAPLCDTVGSGGLHTLQACSSSNSNQNVMRG